MTLLLPLIILAAMTTTPMPVPAGVHVSVAPQRLIQNCAAPDCGFAVHSRPRRPH
jgi:hypothetical protein